MSTRPLCGSPFGFIHYSSLQVTHDNHRYYTSRHYPPGPQADMMWFELSDMIGSGVVQADNLSAIEISNFHRFVQVIIYCRSAT